MILGQGMERLERRLAELCGRQHCVLVGRATTAISLATQSMCSSEGDKVLVPALLCASAANGVLYGGATPHFVDVDLEDANIGVEGCVRAFDREADVAGVLVPHMYGQPADIEALVDLAEANGAFVVEDAAQALGGSLGGRPLGSFGDASVVSFGHTKIVDAGWGGALLTDRDDVAAFSREGRHRFPGHGPEVEVMQREYRRLYYALMPVVEEHPRLDVLLPMLPDLFRGMYLRGPDGVPVDRISDQLESLGEIVGARRKRAALYRELISHERVVPFEPREEAAPWRYSFRVLDGGRDALLDGLRAEGTHASAWYPPIHRWYPSGRVQDTRMISEAIRLGREVVNLWVTPQTPMEDVERASRLVNALLEGRAKAGSR